MATIKEVLLEDDRMEPDRLIIVSHDSYLLKPMEPTPELPLGYQKINRFSEEWLAPIAHLPVREQNEAKAALATKKDEAEEARMTPEMREADRLDAEIFGEIQQKVNARLAAKAATKDAAKGSGSK